jgi:hypothetical protein
MKVVHFEVQAMNNIHAKAFRMSSLIGGHVHSRRDLLIQATGRRLGRFWDGWIVTRPWPASPA